MLYSYNDCIDKYGNNYQIEKLLVREELYKIDSGIYSDRENVSELEVISYKYSNAIFTMDSAFYYHGLTDVIPDKYSLATSKDAHKISDSRVKQIFHRDTILNIGNSIMEYHGLRIQIYDKERMLIELIRNKKKLPFDYYKEIILNYRKCLDSLDIEKLQEYLTMFSKHDYITKTIQLEVF